MGPGTVATDVLREVVMRYVVGLILALALGCGDEGPVLAAELVGTWVFVNAEQYGESWGEDCVTDCDTLAFNADGTYWLVSPVIGRRFDGTWSSQGNLLRLTTTMDTGQPLDPPPTSTFQWSVSENTLTLSNPLIDLFFYYSRDTGAFEVQP
jgi:hypothetical protein